MANIQLPKLYHPDFRSPRKKPLYPVTLSPGLSRGLEALFISDGRSLINLLDHSVSLTPTTSDTADVSISYIHGVGKGVKVSPGTSDNDGLSSGFKISSTSEYTVGYYGRLDNRNSTLRRFMAGQTQVGTGTGYDMGGPYVNTDGTLVFYAKAGSGVGSSTSISNGDVFTWSGRYKSGETDGHRQHINGVLDGVATNTGAAGSSYTYQVGRRWGGFEAANATVALIPVWGRALSDAEIVAWHKAPFASLLELAQPFTLVAASSGGGGAALIGNAIASAVLTANLSTSINMLGSASGSSSAVASLTTLIKLLGDATAQAVATGSLSTLGAGAALTGDALASASGLADLTTSILLGGSAIGSASSTASLLTAIQFLGDALGTSAGTGGLSTAIQLAADANGTSGVAAGLTTGINLAGDAYGLASALADLGLYLEIAGDAVGSTAALAELTTAILLEGNVYAPAQGKAALYGGTSVTTRVQPSYQPALPPHTQSKEIQEVLKYIYDELLRVSSNIRD